MANIFTFLDTVKVRLHLWVKEMASSTKAVWWLAVISFTESSFFIVPPDVLLIAMLSVSAERWIYYSFITSVASVLGGIFGYIVGLFLFDTVGVWLIEFYNLSDQMETVSVLFSENALIAVLVASFTPVPYKLFTITAGFLQADFIVFVVASLLGRSIRFFLVGYFMKVFGQTLGEFVYRRFNQVSFVAGLLIILGLIYIYLG